jgi:hypothetical protein
VPFAFIRTIVSVDGMYSMPPRGAMVEGVGVVVGVP